MRFWILSKRERQLIKRSLKADVFEPEVWDLYHKVEENFERLKSDFQLIRKLRTTLQERTK